MEVAVIRISVNVYHVIQTHKPEDNTILFFVFHALVIFSRLCQWKLIVAHIPLVGNQRIFFKG